MPRNIHVGCEAIAGIYGSDEVDRPATLKWIATERNEGWEMSNESTDLCTVTPGVCYEVTAFFSDKDDDGLMTATVTVAQRGKTPFATVYVRCLAGDLEVMKIYNFQDGEAHIGEIEVGYESEDA